MLYNVPEWFQTSIVGAVFAVAGYIGKLLVDKSQAKKIERSRKLSRLVQLKSLLNASKGLFIIQQSLAKRLIQLIEEKSRTILNGGYEITFTNNYNKFSEDEKILHALIRAYSEKSMKQVNEALSNWLKEDNDFKTGVIKSRKKNELSDKLTLLETHLLLWHAKFDYWIPEHPEHALVYLDDESKHGLGFPEGLDKLVEETICELSPVSFM